MNEPLEKMMAILQQLSAGKQVETETYRQAYHWRRLMESYEVSGIRHDYLNIRLKEEHEEGAV